MALSPSDRTYWHGEIVSFYPDPGMVKDAVVQPGAKRAVGTVMGVIAKPAAEPGAIPDLQLSVRGRSGRCAFISVVQNYAKRHESFAAADAEP